MQRFYRWFLTVLGFFCFTMGFTQITPRKKINFDEGWKFHLGHAADPAKDFNFRIANIYSKSGGAVHTAIDPRFKDSAWQNVRLPHDWAVELPFVNVQNFDIMAHGYK